MPKKVRKAYHRWKKDRGDRRRAGKTLIGGHCRGLSDDKRIKGW